MKADKARERRFNAEQRDTIRALGLAMPPMLAVRFGSLDCCAAASVVGSRILRARGIEARAVPCAVRAIDKTKSTEVDFYLAAGYTQAELIAALGDPDPEHILVSDFVDAGTAPYHVAIEAHPAAGRTIVDVTIEQLIPSRGALVMPIAEGWPTMTIGPWHVEYDASPREADVLGKIATAEESDFRMLQEDVEAVMKLAKDYRCDRDKLYTEMMRQQPDLMRKYRRIAESGLWSRRPARST